MILLGGQGQHMIILKISADLFGAAFCQHTTKQTDHRKGDRQEPNKYFFKYFQVTSPNNSMGDYCVI